MARIFSDNNTRLRQKSEAAKNVQARQKIADAPRKKVA